MLILIIYNNFAKLFNLFLQSLMLKRSNVRVVSTVFTLIFFFFIYIPELQVWSTDRHLLRPSCNIFLCQLCRTWSTAHVPWISDSEDSWFLFFHEVVYTCSQCFSPNCPSWAQGRGPYVPSSVQLVAAGISRKHYHINPLALKPLMCLLAGYTAVI